MTSFKPTSVQSGRNLKKHRSHNQALLETRNKKKKIVTTDSSTKKKKIKPSELNKPNNEIYEKQKKKIINK